MAVVFDFDEVTLFFEVFNNDFSRFVAVKSLIFSAVFVDFSVFVENENFFKVMAFADLKVVGVVAGRNFNAARSEKMCIRDSQKARIIYGFQPELDPLGYGLQPLVSKIALGSGGLTGLGYGNGIQTQNDLLPASSTDFIFGIIGEEFGFIGCLFVIVMLILIVFLIARDAAKAKDYCGKYICVTVAAIIAVQTVINIGMCVGLSPVIGITLPFVSYGGSSVLSMYICLGLVQGTRIRREKVLNFTGRY